MTNQPSEGAKRAARELVEILAPGDHWRNVRMAAALIDRESGLSDLLTTGDALVKVLEHHPVQGPELRAFANALTTTRGGVS